MKQRRVLIPAICVVITGLLAVACSSKRYVAERDARYSTGPSADREGMSHGVTSLGTDELWVVARPERGENESLVEQEPPALRARIPGTETEIPLPLERTEVAARIDASISSVVIGQQYSNPYDEKIEVVYVFPLPHSAAVSDFLMVIGDRRIRGIVREREEALQIYHRARDQGYVASLLTQERPNIFTQKVANIEPGRRIDIEITYYASLPFRDGAYFFELPTVVGPRYNPPGSVTGIGAVARDAAGVSGQSTEVQYLGPSESSAHRFALTVDIEAGASIASVTSSTHEIEVESLSPSRRRITLADGHAVPDRDFILRYQLSNRATASSFLVHEDERGAFFTLLLTPPSELENIQRSPVEHVFVLDCSGSMAGAPLEAAKRAVRHALSRLDGRDTFQIIRFSESASALGPHPVPATPKNVQRGLAYLERLSSGGGTRMIEGIIAALDFPHSDGAIRVVSFMTDGYIGNEAEILSTINARRGQARIFSFGIGNSTNRYLLDSMASVGRGAVAYVGLGDRSAAEAVDQFFNQIAYPALSDLSIDWGDVRVSEVYPSHLPDLWPGRPVVISGRLDGQAFGTAIVRGYAGGLPITTEVDLTEKAVGERPALASLWARMKIADLSRRTLWEPEQELVASIKQVAVEYGLMSSFTAFIAVDSSRRTEGDHGVTVAQPVPVPAGVKYETTVPGSVG